ncbi:MAG: DNA mismatch repair protein MutL, partial [Paraglaciecola sp.]|nr:DNA mismatch repair protein MutL [Paraglaciecola sp.]
FYVNGRMMRDKLINHAVRQAFEGLIGANLYPAYVLYLTLEPNQVDVNVHPAKHEVRFHQARLVHDFIYRALTDSLNQYFQQGQQQPAPEVNVLQQAQPNHGYIKPLQSPTSDTSVSEGFPHYVHAGTQSSGSTGALANKGKAQHLVNSSHINSSQNSSLQQISQSSKNYQQLMTPTQQANSAEHATTMHGQWLKVSGNKILLSVEQDFYLLETAALHLSVMSKLYSDAMPVSQPLLMPISITATADLLAQAKILYQPLLENSVEIGWTPNRIILRKVPAGLRQLRWVEYLDNILSCSKIEVKDVRNHLLTCIVSSEEMNLTQIQELWQQFARSSTDLKHDLAQIAKQVHLNDWLQSNE